MIETLRDFVLKMNDLGIEYMVTGSYAMSGYGEIRMTRDIDIVVELTSRDIRKFYEQFKDAYYISEGAVVRAVENRSMFNIISLNHGGKIDCIIRKDTEFARTSFQRRYKVSVSGIEFWTTTKDDLIVAKLIWAQDSLSGMQIRDIANLTSSEYNLEYVSHWIEKLQLETVWAEVEKWQSHQANRTG